MRHNQITAVLALALTTGPVAATADEPPPVRDQPPSIFQQVFPQPTGDNGFEEIMRASELLSRSKTLGAVENKWRNATLAEKRGVFLDADVARAQALLRSAMSKPLRPIFAPDYDPVKETDRAFRVFAPLRQIARFMAMEQYVLFAEGKTGATLDSLLLGLRLSYSIRSHFLLSGLVADAVDAILLSVVGRHLEQLTAGDCDHLLKSLRQYLAAPDPNIAALENERQISVRTFARLRRESEEMAAFVGSVVEAEFGPSEEEEIPPPLRAEIARLKTDQAARDALASEITQRINKAYDAQIQALKRPSQDFPPTIQASSAKTVADYLESGFVIAPGSVVGRFASTRTRLQLLAVHAAIRRYRWEHNRLPESLAALKLGALAIDPFSENELTYRTISDTTYTLSSVGPRKHDEEGKPAAEEREAVTLLGIR